MAAERGTRSPGRRRGLGRRGGSRLARGLTIAAVAVLLTFFVAGWYFSGVLEEDLLTPAPATTEYTIGVLEVADGRVVLESTSRSRRRGIQGVEWANGYGRLGDVLRENDGSVERRFEAEDGALRPGDLVRIRSFVFRGDPRSAVGLPYDEVSYASPLGAFPAWFTDGDRDTWVILVHGRQSPRDETLRLLPTIAEAGYPALTITYRNDPEAAPSPDGRYAFGDTEWEDLEAAVSFALDGGAEGVVIVGYSAGGAISSSFLTRSELADHVRGVILDAPLLDVAASVEQEAANRGVPLALTRVATFLSSIRFGIDWRAWDRVGEIAELDIPVLLIHGTADDRNPIDVSDRLVSARPDITYLRAADAGHVESWNVDPERYERIVRTFLDEVGG
jgi:uncharacterized protein